MAERALAPDQPARERIACDLATTLFVEAGAGSGKTTALVTRVLALVESGVELRHIAAITFTEKAAAELRDRIREKLEQAASANLDAQVRDRCRAALDQLDSAAIGTLHSFAQRVLSEHPVEAGLPPRVEVLDEVASGVEFERRWRGFRDQLFADRSLERTLLLLLACGVDEKALRGLALTFGENWDLVAERVPGAAPDPPDARALFAPVRAELEALCAERSLCRDPDDRMVDRLEQIEAYIERLAALDDEVDLVEALHPEAQPKPPSFSVSRCGRKTSWPTDLDELRDRLMSAGDRLAAVRNRVAEAAAKRLGVVIRRFTLGAARERREAGRLEFHDLLVLARSLLRDRPHGAAVRADLANRYRRLLLDEFQDTDPIQVELAVRIAAAEPESSEAGEAAWHAVEVAPGRLFVVGDPKQSIYRFRRADIATFLGARDRFGPEGGGPVQLTANFRTADPVIAWVNHTFAALMSETPDAQRLLFSQSDYVPLQAVRGTPPVGAPVSVVGRAMHPKGYGADDVRLAEAADIAAVVARAIDEGWTVDDGHGGWRPARLGDITILVPARTSLPFLEDALEEAGVPFRAESSSLVYASRAVRDLLMVLRAADDPTDHLRIVSALRTPLFACGDDDLLRHRQAHRGSWSYLADPPEPLPPGDPVVAGLAYLRELHRARQWHAPSVLLDRIARDRRALELGFAEGRPRDVWRRLRFVVDQARAWSEATGGSLRQYLQWVDQQTAEGARVAESILPETDDDAVRIMTIHAAKGLEFPITIVSGMSTAPQSRAAAAQAVFPPNGEVGYKFGRHVETVEWGEWKPVDEQMAFDERVRLLYVATTRARDHLILSLHRKERASAPKPASRTNAELLVDGMGDELDGIPDAVEVEVEAAPAESPAPAGRDGAASDGGSDAGRAGVPRFEPEPPPAPPAFDEWRAERDAALGRASRPTAVAATALTEEGAPDVEGEPDPGLQKRPRDLDLPPWLKGRYGTAVGRAVHGVLQTIDLATGDGVDAAVAAQCEAEAVPQRAGDVRRLVEHALGSPSVREAAAAAHWREVYACTPLEGGRLLEGYVDLLYRGPHGLVVVDYKTASTDDPDELARRVDGYRLQGAAYAVAVGATTAEQVAAVVFVFLTPKGAVELPLTDLDAAVTDVRARVAAGREEVLG